MLIISLKTEIFQLNGLRHDFQTHYCWIVTGSNSIWMGKESLIFPASYLPTCCITDIFMPDFSADPLSNVDDSVCCHPGKVTAALCESVCVRVFVVRFKHWTLIHTQEEECVGVAALQQEEEEDPSTTHKWVDVFSSCWYIWIESDTKPCLFWSSWLLVSLAAAWCCKKYLQVHSVQWCTSTFGTECVNSIMLFTIM